MEAKRSVNSAMSVSSSEMWRVAANIRRNRFADVAERYVDAGERQRIGVCNQSAEREPHRGRVAKDPVERGSKSIEVQERFVDIEDKHRWV
jgi:hypothetical protein